MTCKKCGKELADGTKKCDGCGEKVKLKFSDLPATEKKKRAIIGGVCFVIAIVLVIAGAIGGMNKTDKYILAVTEGTLDDFSDKTVGEAFDDFFDDPEWKSFTDDKDRIIVEFNGGCTWHNEEANCCIQFEVDEDGEEFEIYYADIDEEVLNDFEIVEMLEVIYEE